MSNETTTETVNELAELADGTLQWTMDRATYSSVSGMYAIGLGAIVFGGAYLGARVTSYVLNRIQENKEKQEEYYESVSIKE